ncbi:MAG TPA: PilN domain-containing protein [Phycisphaerales bacterium]|nr:PilN domain-containing protein [Phycisphaerales bacterium]
MSPRRTSSRPLAALHRQGGQWRLLVASFEPSGRGAAAPGVRVHAALSFDTARPEPLRAALRAHRPARVLRLLPAGQTVCRVARLPVPGDPAQDPTPVVAALGLMAEAELPSAIPPHRRAAGLLRPGPAGSPPLPLLVGWVSGPGEPSGLPAPADAHVPEPVCLAALAQAESAGSALYADRDSGAICVLAVGPAQPVARVLRADPAADWARTVRGALDQARQSAGLEPVPAPAAEQPRLLHLSGPGRPVSGTPADPAWRQDFGLALGALLAETAAVRDAALAPLLGLREEPEPRSGPMLRRAAEWLARPSRAGVAVLVALALMLLWPLGVAVARQEALAARAGSTDALQRRLGDASRRAAFATLLRAHRWPMTKLLSDAAAAAPVGVRAVAVELAPETGLAVRGVADSAELVADYIRNLNQSRVFSDAAAPSVTAADEPGRVDFQISARVVAPYFPAKPVEDYAARSLAERLYGEQAASDEDRPAARVSADRADDPDPARASRRGRTPRPPSAVGPVAPAAPPPPLTDEEIAALDRTKAMLEYARRRKAASETTDPQLKERLSAESEKARRRMEELNPK